MVGHGAVDQDDFPTADSLFGEGDSSFLSQLDVSKIQGQNSNGPPASRAPLATAENLFGNPIGTHHPQPDGKSTREQIFQGRPAPSTLMATAESLFGGDDSANLHEFNLETSMQTELKSARGVSMSISSSLFGSDGGTCSYRTDTRQVEERVSCDPAPSSLPVFTEDNFFTDDGGIDISPSKPRRQTQEQIYFAPISSSTPMATADSLFGDDIGLYLHQLDASQTQEQNLCGPASSSEPDSVFGIGGGPYFHETNEKQMQEGVSSGSTISNTQELMATADNLFGGENGPYFYQPNAGKAHGRISPGQASSTAADSPFGSNDDPYSHQLGEKLTEEQIFSESVLSSIPMTTGDSLFGSDSGLYLRQPDQGRAQEPISFEPALSVALEGTADSLFSHDLNPFSIPGEDSSQFQTQVAKDVPRQGSATVDADLVFQDLGMEYPQGQYSAYSILNIMQTGSQEALGEQYSTEPSLEEHLEYNDHAYGGVNVAKFSHDKHNILETVTPIPPPRDTLIAEDSESPRVHEESSGAAFPQDAVGLPSADILFGESISSDLFLPPASAQYANFGLAPHAQLADTAFAVVPQIGQGHSQVTENDRQMHSSAVTMPIEVGLETEDLFATVSPSEHTLDDRHAALPFLVDSQKITSEGNRRRPPSQQQWTDVPLDQGPFSAGQQAFSNMQSPILSPPPPERRLGSLIDSATLGAVEELLAMPKSAAFERGMSRLFKGVKNSAHSIFSSPTPTAIEKPSQEQSRFSSVSDRPQDNMRAEESFPNSQKLELSAMPFENIQRSPTEVLPPPPRVMSPPPKVLSPPPKATLSPPPKATLSPPPKATLSPPPKATQQQKAYDAPQPLASKMAAWSVENHDWALRQSIQPVIEYMDMLPPSDPDSSAALPSSSVAERNLPDSSDKAQRFEAPSEPDSTTGNRFAGLAPNPIEQEAPQTPRFVEAVSKARPHMIRNKKEELLDKARELRERRQKNSDVPHHQPRSLQKLSENTVVLDAQKAVEEHPALDSLQTINIRTEDENSNATVVDKDIAWKHIEDQLSYTADSINIDPHTPDDVNTVVLEPPDDVKSMGGDLQVPSLPGDLNEPHVAMAGFTTSDNSVGERSMEDQTAVMDRPEVQHLLEVNETMKADLKRLQVLAQEHEAVMTANRQLTDAIVDKDRLLSELRQQHESLRESIPDLTSKNAELVIMSTSAEQLSKDIEGLHRQLKDQRSDMKELQEQLRLAENEKKAQASSMSQLHRSLEDSNKQVQELKSHQVMKDEAYKVIQKQLFESFEEEKAQYVDDEALKMAKLEYRYGLLQEEIEVLRAEQISRDSNPQPLVSPEVVQEKESLEKTVVFLKDRVSVLEASLVHTEKESLKKIDEVKAETQQKTQVEVQLRAAVIKLEGRISTMQVELNIAQAEVDERGELELRLAAVSRDLEHSVNREQILEETLARAAKQRQEKAPPGDSVQRVDDDVEYSSSGVEYDALAERAAKWQEECFAAQEDKMLMEDKLLRTEMELMSVRTQIEELEESSTRLQEERDQAEQDLEALREIDQQLHHDKHLKADEEVAKITAELEGVRAELLAARFESSRLQANAVTWGEEKMQLANKLKEVTEELAESKANAERIQCLLSDSIERVSLLESTSHTRDSNVNVLEVQLSEVRSELVTAKSEASQLSVDLARTRDERNWLEDQLEHFSSELQDVRNELEQAEARQLEARAQAADADAEQGRLKARLEEATHVLAQERMEVTRLQSVVDQIGSLQDSESQLSKVTVRVQELEKVLKERDQRVLESEAALRELQAKCLRLQKDKDEVSHSQALVHGGVQDPKSTELHQKLNRAEMDIVKLQQFLQEFQNEKKQAIAELQSKIEDSDSEVAQVRSQLAKAQAMLLTRESSLQVSPGPLSQPSSLLPHQPSQETVPGIQSSKPPQGQLHALWSDDTFKGTEKVHHEAILEVESLQHQKADLERTLQDLRHRYELSQKENDTLLSQLEKENKNLRAKAERLSPDLSTEHLERIREQELELFELSRQLKTAQREREFTRQDMRSLKAELSKLKAAKN